MLQSAVCLCAVSAQALQDPGVYGVIQSGDHRGRTCVVKWIQLNSSSDDVEVSQENKTTVFVFFKKIVKLMKIQYWEKVFAPFLIEPV